MLSSNALLSLGKVIDSIFNYLMTIVCDLILTPKLVDSISAQLGRVTVVYLLKNGRNVHAETGRIFVILRELLILV